MKISDTTAYRRAQRWAGLEEGPVLSDPERRELESYASADRPRLFFAGRPGCVTHRIFRGLGAGRREVQAR